MSCVYDKHYYLRHLSYAGSDTERSLNEFRFSLVKKVLDFQKVDHFPSILLVDYGCSHGAFLKILREHLVHSKIVGVDINPYCVSHCVREGLRTFTPEMFDHFFLDAKPFIMTFWDVLEHIRDPKDFLKQHRPEFICTSLPCLDGFYESRLGKKTNDIQLWKHYRPLEHLWGFTVESFIKFMESCKYEVVYQTFDESKIRIDPTLGDKNIMSFILKRGE